MLEVLITPHREVRANEELKIYEPLNLELAKVAFPGSTRPKAHTAERRPKQQLGSGAKSQEPGDTTERTKVNLSILHELQLLEQENR